MLGKLLKYDFRSMVKQFAIVWPTALLLAGINRIMLNFGYLDRDTFELGSAAQVLTLLLYVAILMAMFVMAVVFVVQRFYKGVLGDEGYLMHTLPVRTWQLTFSKLLCALVVVVVSILVAIASIFIFAIGEVELGKLWRDFLMVFREENGNVGLLFVEFILLILVGMAASFLMIYLAMGIGHLFSKNRVAMSVVAFVALNWGMNLLLNLLAWKGLDSLSDTFWENARVQGSQWLYVHGGVWIAIAVQLVLGAAFFAGTNWILSRRLNLE